MTIGEIDADL